MISTKGEQINSACSSTFHLGLGDHNCPNPEVSYFNFISSYLPSSSPMTTTLHSSNPNPNSDTLFSSLNSPAMAQNLPPFSHQTLDDDTQSDSSDLTDFRSPLYSHPDDARSDAVSQSHSSDLGDIPYTDDLDPNDVVPQSHSQTASESGNPNLTSSSSPVPTLLHLSFNQDSGCFAVGTDRGFRIYNCDPFREIFRRDFDSGGGIGVVQMLFRCNILALVGGGPEPEYPLNKVMIWDDHQSRCIGELSFRSEVKSVRLRRDRIVVILAQKIFVYNFADLKLLHQIETIANPKGLCEVSHVSGSMVLVCPGLQKGQVRVEHYASKRTKFIMAHDSRIACFALTNDGRLLATASSKGTLVRVYNTMDGSLLQEVSLYLSISCCVSLLKLLFLCEF